VDRPLGWLELEKGRHTLSFVCVGKDGRSSGYYLGINDVALERIPVASETPSLKAHAPAAPSPGMVYRGRPLSAYLNQSKSAETLRAIGSFGPDAAPAVNQIASALNDPDPDVRSAAAWALSQIGGPGAAAVPALEKSLADSNARVRSLSAVALQSFGPKAVVTVPALIAALRDPSPNVRAPAADALGSIGPAAEAAVEALTERLLITDDQAYVLRSMASALGNIGPAAATALPALQQTLKLHRVVYAAREAILKINQQPVPVW
jgi:HEAT repeat protein